MLLLLLLSLLLLVVVVVVLLLLLLLVVVVVVVVSAAAAVHLISSFFRLLMTQVVDLKAMTNPNDVTSKIANIKKTYFQPGLTLGRPFLFLFFSSRLLLVCDAPFFFRWIDGSSD
jgi:hypothetical protein